MVRTEISALIGILFVIVAGANVWLMFHRMSPAGSGPRGAVWAQAHRAGGYIYLALYLVMMYLMVLRLREASDELAPRALLHTLLGFTLAPVLFVKILIARTYRNQAQYLTPLGLILFCLSFMLVSITAGPYLLRRSAVESISLASVGMSTERIDLRQAEELMRSRCGRCHALDRVVGARKDAPGWLETVNRMRALPGSGISESDARTILFYLVKSLGVDSSKPAGRQLVERALVDARCGRCHSLDTVYRAQKTPAEWKATIARMVKLAPAGHFKQGEPEQILAYLSGQPMVAAATLAPPANAGGSGASTSGSGGGATPPGSGKGQPPPNPGLWSVVVGSALIAGLLYWRAPGSRRAAARPEESRPAAPAGALAPAGPATREPTPATGSAEPAAASGRGRITLTLARIIEETPTTRTFRFLVPPDAGLSHRAGQFLTFDWLVEGEKVVRSYSISSSPSRSAHHLDITVKRVPDGRVSPYLHDHIGVGLTVTARPPAGKFVLPDPPLAHVLCIAAGSGITPIMSILRWIDDTGLPIAATLLYSVRTSDEIIFEREIARLTATLPGFRAAVTLTQPSPEWTGEKGRLNQEMLERHCPALTDSMVYLCGPKPFMEAAHALLTGCGVPGERIRQEIFGGPPAAPTAPTAEAAAPAGPRVAFSRSGQQCSISEGRTLLEMAEMHGVPIPYSCRQGQCGTCATRLLAGEVRMDAEDGLDPDLRRQGYVLTCVGRAQGDVTLEA